MMNWKVFIPDRQDLEGLSKISPRGLFVSRINNPIMESVYLLDSERGCVSLSWNYFDVEFKFEIYGMSIDGRKKCYPEDVACIKDINKFSSMSFLLRSEWVRPARPGEVPDHFEQVKEESGTAASVPTSAISVGTCLYGIVFNDANSSPFLIIAADDNERYSLKYVVVPEEMEDLIGSCDLCTFSQLLDWSPPEETGKA